MLAVTDDDPEVRMLAAEALGKEGRFEVIDTLVSLLRDPDLWVRAAAARGLGRIGGERAAAVLAASPRRRLRIYFFSRLLRCWAG